MELLVWCCQVPPATLGVFESLRSGGGNPLWSDGSRFPETYPGYAHLPGGTFELKG